MIRFLLIAAVLLAGTAATAMADEPAGAAVEKPVVQHQQSQVLDRSVKVNIKYLLYLPEDYDKQAAWPLLLFLHGAGERGDDLQMVKKHGPPKMIEAGHKFPFIVVSPQCPKERWWEPFELTALLDDVSEHYKVDPDRRVPHRLEHGRFRNLEPGGLHAATIRGDRPHLRRRRAVHRQTHRPHSHLGFSRSEGFGRIAGSIGEDGRGHEEGWQRRPVHRLSRCGP